MTKPRIVTTPDGDVLKLNESTGDLDELGTAASRPPAEIIEIWNWKAPDRLAS